MIGTTDLVKDDSGRLLADRARDIHWSSAKLLAFRFCLTYFVLEWLALITLLNTPALSAGVLKGPGWWGNLNFAIGQWSITHVLGLPDHSPPRFSANALPLFLGMLVVGLISAIVAVAWSALDRRRVNHRLRRIDPSSYTLLRSERSWWW